MKLYDFQEQSVDALMNGKHFIIAGCGVGKTAMAVVWADKKCMQSGKDKLLIVTTASKSKTGDFVKEIDEWCPSLFESLSSFSVLSWHKLRAWVEEHRCKDLSDYVFVFDECQRAKAGVSSGMGRAFLKITSETDDWAAFTGTPGDSWLSFYPYFQACGLVKNKTSFMRSFANVQTYKGYPEIVGWRGEKTLRDMWRGISYSPNTDKIMAELPSQTHTTVLFRKPSGYGNIVKTRYNDAGEFLDTPGALCAELRRKCFSNAKQCWIKDFVDGLESGCVFFYNFVSTGDRLEQIIKSSLPDSAKVWRIDGSHHEIPTADTIGPRDMVLCQWQSGSEALNLQFLHYWCSVEACYSYSTSIQARGRIRRIGQGMPQFYYYLKTERTIEDAIYEALRTKSDFSEDVWCENNKLN